MNQPYRISRYPHSRTHRWQWRCLHPRCPQGGLARSEDQANTDAIEHTRTHQDGAQQ